MELLQHATVLNNMGAHMLDANNALGAIQAFQQAIHAMKDVTKIRMATTSITTTVLPPTTINTDNDDGCRDDRTMNDEMYLYQSLHCIQDVVTKNTRPTSGTIGVPPRPLKKMKSTNGSHQYILHDRALMLPTTTRMEMDLEVPIRNATIIIMFNICIACHQLGTSRCQAATVMHALRIYELVVEMIMQRLTLAIAEPYLRVVLCLTLNNMASIHYDFCDFDNGMICIGYMQRMLMRYSEMMDTIALQFIPRGEWNDVKLNALFLQAPSAAQAA